MSKCRCGGEAALEIKFTNIPDEFKPMCQECYNDHLDKAKDTNDHEMKNFGGAYGLVTWEERPVTPTDTRCSDCPCRVGVHCRKGYQSALDENERLKNEITRLSGQTGFCIDCERQAREIVALREAVRDLYRIWLLTSIRNSKFYKDITGVLKKHAVIIEQLGTKDGEK